MSEAGDKLVLDYLDRVADIAQGRLRPMDRITLIEELRAQIDAQRKRRGDGPDAVRAILARQGSPKSQVDARLIQLAQPEGFDTDDGTGAEPEPEAGSSMPASPSAASPVTPTSPIAPTARAGRGARRDVPVVPVSTPVDDEAEDTDSDDMSPVIVAPVVIFAVFLLVSVFNWWGFLIYALVALVFPRVPRGVRIVALLWIPFWLFLPMVVTGIFLGMRTVLGTVWPLTAGVLGALYLMWGATRLPKLRQRR